MSGCKVFSFYTVSSDTLQALYSIGFGRYSSLSPDMMQYYEECFSVVETHDRSSLDITIKSDYLKQFLREIMPAYSHYLQDKLPITLDHLLPYYPALKDRVSDENRRRDESHLPTSCEERSKLFELRLFVQDFLLERSIFERFGSESLYKRNILTTEHWQDIQRRSVRDDLDDLDEKMELYMNSESKPEGYSPSLQLRHAIKQGDYGAVASMIQNLTCVDARTLCTAIKFFKEPILRLLVDHGSMVNGDKSDVTAEPLKCAARAGNLVAVEVLIGGGANIEGTGSRVSTSPLAGAASGGHFNVVQYLVEKNANVNGNGFKSPIACAVKHGYMQIADYLVIDHGADINNASYWKLLSTASSYKKERMILYALNKCKTLNEYYYEKLLCHAAEIGSLNIVEMLIRRGTHVKPLYYNRNPLLLAEKNGHQVVAHYLHQSGADRSARGTRDPPREAFPPPQFMNTNPASYPDNSKIITAIQAQEHQWTCRKLLSRLDTSRQLLVDACGSPSSPNLELFAVQQGTNRNIWERGTRVICSIIDGRLPNELQDIISCLQVVDGMRSVASNSELVCTMEEFISDIVRWYAPVNPDERHLFLEIASCLWGYTPRAVDSERVFLGDMLEFFQTLVGNLVDQWGVYAFGQTTVNRYRLRYLRQHYPHTTPPVHRPNEPCPPDGREIWQAKRSAHTLGEYEKCLAKLKKIAVLMMKAVFSLILLHLCLIRHGPGISYFLLDAAGKRGNSAPNKILVGNSVILMTYLMMYLELYYLTAKTWVALRKRPSSLLSGKDEPYLDLSCLTAMRWVAVGTYLFSLLSSKDEPQSSQYQSSGLQFTTNMPPPTQDIRTAVKDASDRLGTDDTAAPFTVAENCPNSASEPRIQSATSDLSTSAPYTTTTGSIIPSPPPERGLVCKPCSMTFKGKSARGNLNKHNKRKHPELIQKVVVYRCRCGGYSDIDQSNVRRHAEKFCPLRDPG